MIPDFLSDLHLDQVFAAYTACIDPYIQISAEHLERIVDSEVKHISGFVRPGFGQKEAAAGKYFTINNPSGKEFALLQIDHAAIQSKTTKKCDCAVMTDKDLLLVEFKTDAIRPNNNYKKALTQLSVTKALFQSRLAGLGINLHTIRNVEAFVCFKKGFPRLTASEMQYRVAFSMATGGTPISFDSFKTI